MWPLTLSCWINTRALKTQCNSFRRKSTRGAVHFDKETSILAQHKYSPWAIFPLIHSSRDFSVNFCSSNQYRFLRKNRYPVNWFCCTRDKWVNMFVAAPYISTQRIYEQHCMLYRNQCSTISVLYPLFNWHRFKFVPHFHLAIIVWLQSFKKLALYN